MHRNLTVSIIQPVLNPDMADSLLQFQQAVDRIMSGYVKPELIIGVEHGLGQELDTVPGVITQFMGALAKRYGIYLIPGTLSESAPELPHGEFYNTVPVFGPDGSLIDVYRKKAPFKPGEPSTPSGDDHYCVFEIREKQIKVGVQICYDQFFPEITRTLALLGAELIVCPALDPMEFDHIPDVIPRARALENEVFYIWTNGVGNSSSATCCGHSTIVNPEGKVVYKCGSDPMTFTQILDFNEVTNKRLYGRDQHLNCLRRFRIPYPFAGKLDEAPVYQGMPPVTYDPQSYLERVSEIGVGSPAPDLSASEVQALDDKMRSLLRSITPNYEEEVL